MDELIKSLQEQYQDIEYNGVTYKGKRNCTGRWDIIKNHIPTGVIYDLGSSQGYYTRKIAEDKRRVIVSFEREPASVAIQKLLFKDMRHVAICQGEFMEDDFAKLLIVPEQVDCVIALSILHHFQDPTKMVAILSQLTPCLIVEIPADNEKNAIGLATRSILNKELFELHFDFVEQIGTAKSHMDDVERPIYKCTNNRIVRKNLLPYIGCVDTGRATHTLEHNYIWTIGGKSIIDAVNVKTLLEFNVQYPSKDWFKEEAREAYADIELKTDVRVWNLLFTAYGLIAIDYNEEGEHLAHTEKDFEVMDMLFEKIGGRYVFGV